MRTLLIILLFVSGFAFAQPSINNPTPLQVCDDGNDGIESFNLFSKNAEVLGSLNASNHTVSYHETLVDAENNFNALPSSYNNIVNNQILYVRVIENSSPTLYSTTTLILEAVSYPLITTMPNVTVCESYTLPALPFGQNYYTGPNGTGSLIPVGVTITSTQTIYIFSQTLSTPTCTSESSFIVTVNPSPGFVQPSNLIQNDLVFDLQAQNSVISGGVSVYTIVYFTSLADAQNNSNPIANPSAYNILSNPQTIYARVEDNATGCFSITNFDLIVNINPFAINNPTPLQVCDDNNDTFGVFDLTTKESEILGALNPSDYSVTFFASFVSAQANTNIITNPTSYVNVSIYTQTIGVRVTNTTTSEYAVTTLDLIVNPLPILNSVPNLTQFDNDGYASFDLTTHNSLLIAPASITDYSFLYYPTITDASNGTNLILDFFNYTNSTNPQNIIVKVTNNVTGCYQFSGFDLVVQANDFPINTPTTLSTCGNASGFSNFDLHSKDAEILGSLNPSNYTVTFYINSNDAFNEQNALASPFTNTTASYQTIFVRVDENSTASFSTTTLQLYSVPPPFIATTVPNLTITENPFDGVATFNLTLQNNYITTIPTQIINFYTIQTDAETLSNPISNTSSFTGNHLQVIWFSLTEPTTGCSTIGSFILNVVDSATVVYIPDVNFKAKLIQLGVDSNSDGEIQYTEAAVVTNLAVYNSNISDLTGILSFPLLQNLNCSQNQLTNLNVAGLANLNTLNCEINQLTNLNISGCVNLTNLSANSNQLTSINFNGLGALTDLNISVNQIASLDIDNLNNLNSFNCSNNQLTSLYINGGNFSSFNCTSNLLSSLTAINCSAFIFHCEGNQLTSLDVSNSNIALLNCSNNQLSSINLSTTIITFEFNCSNNLLSSIDVSGKQFSNFFSHNNLLTTLDVSTCTNLNIFSCDSNPLISLYMKNGKNESVFFPNDPNLLFICVDESQINTVETMANPATVISTYCSFTPGGDFNTLTGTATFDINNNGCDASDIPFDLLGLNVSLNGVSTNSSVFTNNSGVYNLYASIAGEYQLTPNLENPTYFNVSPGVQSFPVIDNSTATQNICITANGVHPDLEIVIAPITPARPGFDALYQIVYKNKGNQTLSGSFNFNYDDSKLDFVSSTVVPSSSTTGILTWNYTNLLPFENRTVYVTLNVNSPIEIPAVNIGDVFTFSSSINPISGDETPSDNAFTYAQTIVGSYDPNDITCLEGQTVSPSEIGEYLHYIVNFENTGNYYAENVVVKIEIDETKYDISSLQLLNKSHENKSKITNNIVEFIFEDINLVAASGNPPVGGHGNVLFKIKSKDNLVSGDMVQKAAKIYFDYNAPIETNLSQTTYQSLTNPIFEFDESVKIYPNPTNGIININSNFNIKSVELYDVQGRILEKSFENNSTTTLNISERQNGIYFIKITSDKGSKVEKVVKN